MINRKDWSSEGLRGDVEYPVSRGLATIEPHEDGGVTVTLEKIE